MKASLYDRPQSASELSLQEALELSAARGRLDEELDLSAPRDLRDDMELSVPRDLRDDLQFSLGQDDSSSPYGGELSMNPSLRDHEYMSHGHLIGNMLAQFPPG